MCLTSFGHEQPDHGQVPVCRVQLAESAKARRTKHDRRTIDRLQLQGNPHNAAGGVNRFGGVTEGFRRGRSRPKGGDVQSVAAAAC